MWVNSIKCILAVCITAIFVSCAQQETAPLVLTKYRSTLEATTAKSPVGEGINKLNDGDFYSKFLTFSNKAEFTVTPIKKSKLNKYSLVSGNDEAQRDPHSWTLEASNDKQNWTIIDTRDSVVFFKRNQQLEFPIAPNKHFSHYRFRMATKAHDILQLSEIELYGNWDPNDKSPIAQFEAKSRIFFDQGEVQFSNLSEKADSYEWFFEGGTPATSTEQNPEVSYSKHGRYPVRLIVKNGALTDTIYKENYVLVKRHGAWEQFPYPTINFVNKSVGGNGDLYTEMVPDPHALINEVCLNVSKLLFKSVDEVDVLKILDYSVEDIETISAKGGNPPHINIFFSSSYLKNKQGEMSQEALLAEIVGVLYHEITHGYQYSPKGAGTYRRGDDYFGFLEGSADYVRYKAGYIPLESRKAGGHWNDGYKTSGFFIDWLHTKDSDFLYKFNQSALTIIPWSWEEACQEILSASVADLWKEYQNEIAKKES